MDLEEIRRQKKWEEEEFFPKNEIREVKDFSLGTPVSVAGRILLRRDLGAIFFLTIGDIGGKIQVLLRENIARFDQLKVILDVGDLIGVEGGMMQTKTGELTIEAQKLFLLTKSVKPWPDKRKGILDDDLRQRYRYVDLILSDETKGVFKIRHETIKKIRGFLEKKFFVEVETPILQNVASGAAAKPFKTYHDSLNLDMYLRIAPELFLKRLVVGGYTKIFEIAKCFRNEGIDRTHLQEFTMLEAYQAYISYEDLMQLCIDILFEIGLLKSKEITRVSYVDFLRGAGVQDIFDKNELLRLAKMNKLEIKSEDHLVLLELIYKKLCVSKTAGNLDAAVLVYDYPSCPLAKEAKDSRFSKQFQIIVDGFEVAKACLEMTDPDVQKRNFEIQKSLTGTDDFVEKDDDFLTALEYGMPPTGGLGIGIDRVVKILTQKESLREVIFFPNLK